MEPPLKKHKSEPLDVTLATGRYISKRETVMKRAEGEGTKDEIGFDISLDVPSCISSALKEGLSVCAFNVFTH